MAAIMKRKQKKKEPIGGNYKELPSEDEVLLDEFFSLLARIAMRILTNSQPEPNNNGTIGDQGA
jgi:hypothetical protein